jgi:hypothetical protein
MLNYFIIRSNNNFYYPVKKYAHKMSRDVSFSEWHEANQFYHSLTHKISSITIKLLN